jgi:hypothetical protein
MPRTTTAPAESTGAGHRTGSRTTADLAFLAYAMKAPAPPARQSAGGRAGREAADEGAPTASAGLQVGGN